MSLQSTHLNLKKYFIIWQCRIDIDLCFIKNAVSAKCDKVEHNQKQ